MILSFLEFMSGSKQAEKYAADRMRPDALATGTGVGFPAIGQRQFGRIENQVGSSQDGPFVILRFMPPPSLRGA
jgi:hypothetical protein